MKTKKRVVVDLYGVAGHGSTKTEAKADAERQIEKAFDGSYMPVVIRFPAGYIGLTYRSAPYCAAHGWEYCYLSPDETMLDAATVYTHSGFESRADAERALRRHVAQNLIFVTDDNGMDVLVDGADRLHHNEYVAWQLRYRDYKAQGYNDTDCHRMACESRAFCPRVVQHA